MSSGALTAWHTTGNARLDELDKVHGSATGPNRGRRWGTEQLNRSFFIAMTAQVQIYSRALHDEAVAVHLRYINHHQQAVVKASMTQGRKLDTGNPRRSSLGSDFGRLGLDLIRSVGGRGAQAEADLDALDRVVEFRNAISHGNDAEVAAMVATGTIKATKASYREHRKILDRLVGTIDDVVSIELSRLLHILPPW